MVITLIVVLAMGFQTVETNVVAFHYDGNAMKLEEDVRHMLPPDLVLADLRSLRLTSYRQNLPRGSAAR